MSHSEPLTPDENRIIDWVRDRNGPFTSHECAAALALPLDFVNRVLREMAGYP